uniref:Ig-like domain-containing protein n=1 Tax=Anser cygnoides TaxID=8845 RepID=A0A8B9D1C2_ANSCY
AELLSRRRLAFSIVALSALFLGVKEAVKSESFIAAALGGEANIYCNFSLSLDVLQVTWQKRNGSSFQNIATYSKTYGLRLIGSFQKKARFTRAALKASAITIQNLTFEDESCYRCIFNAFPDGSYSKDICLNIQSKNTNKSGVGTLGYGSPATRDMRYLWYLFKNKMVNVSVQSQPLEKNLRNILIAFHALLQRPRALSTPAREKGLEQDVSEQAANLCTPKDQRTAYQNEEETPGSWLRKRLPGKKRNLEETPRYSLSFPEEAESPDVLQRELAEVCDKELGCMPMVEHREATAGGEPESGPDTAAPQPSTGEPPAHQSPVSTSPEEQ